MHALVPRAALSGSRIPSYVRRWYFEVSNGMQRHPMYSPDGSRGYDYPPLIPASPRAVTTTITVLLHHRTPPQSTNTIYIYTPLCV